ncbi:MAG: MarR family transcriptional regulator [Alphaproteobacteria bacterium]|nr:MarR family transcriptional regulator [Alphaproteobacteria bacterium]
MRSARLFNEQGIARVRALGGEDVRLAHTRLFPHIDFEGVRPTELAERTGLTKQAVGQLVKEMEAQGMVRREPDPRDGRAVLVRFTAQGLEAMRHGLGVLGDLESELTEAVGPERMHRLREDLVVLLRALEALEP